eukprot:GHVR01107613.1.p1 GENE.GHVR01107613.1~~GHVR01107613.1.p1  ORF type:complete len:336 (-),score=33.14 GHVR01107613.1:73-1080(-)
MSNSKKNNYDYYESIKTNSKTMGSVSKTAIKGISQVPSTYEIYLTYTQKEKIELKSAGYNNTLTVHEAQGKTYMNVCLVRLVVQQDNIYDSVPHNLVALSRHKNNFEYCTVFPNDPLWTLLGKHVTEPEKSVKINKEIGKTWIMNIGGVETVGLKTYTAVIDTKPTDTIQFIFHFFRECWQAAMRAYKIITRYLTYFKTNKKTEIFESDIIIVQETINALYDIDLPKDKLYEMIPTERILKQCKIRDHGKLNLEQIESSEKFCIPKLRTTQPKVFKGSLRHILYSIAKRNLDPPMIHTVRSSTMVDDVVSIFFETLKKTRKHGIAKPTWQVQPCR